MRRHAWVAGIVVLVTLAGGAAPVASQAGGGLPPGALRQAAYGRALGEIGRSGLRSLLSASGNLGDLQNRAGSYRLAAQSEHSRTASLEGRIEPLDQALRSPELPSEERATLTTMREAARAELASVPRYEAAYLTATAQVEALMPLTFAGERPVFLLVRGRGHVREDGEGGLTVFSEGASLGPVLVGSRYRWIVSPGLSVGRTDVTIGPFDGTSGSTSVGPRLDLGAILGDGWSAAVQIGRVWSHGASAIIRTGPAGGTEVRTEGWSRTTAAKVEVKGRLPLAAPGGTPVSVRPRIGAFVVSTHSPPSTNSLGETGTGPFGETERLAALRVGASLDSTLGSWGPSLYLGWEHELTHRMATLIGDPRAVLGVVGLSRSWGRGRRIALDYTFLRGTRGLRRVGELTLVAILDG